MNHLIKERISKKYKYKAQVQEIYNSARTENQKGCFVDQLLEVENKFPIKQYCWLLNNQPIAVITEFICKEFASFCNFAITPKFQNINISGGVLDVQTTSSSDTDAIDSNNTITITGGLIIARVPGSNPSSAFDWETGTLQMSNATFVALGTVEKTVSGGNKYTGYSGLSSSGNHTITYYTSSSITATYTYNNATSMNSSITVMSNYSKPTFN